MDGLNSSGRDGESAELWSGVSPGPCEHIFFGRERRMHARAYDLWVSLLGGRPMPTLAELDPARIASFAANSVIIDLPPGPPGPSIAFVGQALREEARIDGERPHLGDVPDGTLLAELLRRYPEIIAHRAPVGFEAEFIGRSGAPTLYRGMLLPFGADRQRIGAVYGVISWRQLAAVNDAPDIAAAIGSTRGARPAPVAASAWGDGPGAPIVEVEQLPPQPLDQRLAAARTWAAIAAADRTRRLGSIHAALGAAYDLLLAGQADPAAFAALPGQGAPAAPEAVVDLVFGETPVRRERARYIAVLIHAQRLGLASGRLPEFLERQRGGFAGLAAAERRTRRLAARDAGAEIARARLAAHPALGHIELTPVTADFLLLLARRAPQGVDVVAQVDDAQLTAAVLARAAG